MLPSAELDDVSKSENYTEEIEDSYGEIANIVAGSYTKAFEDSFPKDCRFVRKEQEVVVPAKMEISSAEPFPDQYYYWVCSDMKLDDQEMGEMSVLIPALAFGLEVPGQDDHEGEPVSEQGEVEKEAPQNVAEEVVYEGEVAQEPQIETQENSEQTPVLTGKALDKHKKLVDKLLQLSKQTIAEEVGALLGVSVKLGEADNTVISKEDFFQEEVSGKQVLAEMDVVGDAEGKSYLFVSLKDAIRTGSTLIMLPPSELETAVSEEEFTEDVKDAYGEIANIISGAYTTIFQDQYSQSIRFVKKEIEVIAPLKVDCDGDEVIPNQLYYLSSSRIEIDNKECGRLSLLLPIDLMGLEQLGGDAEADEDLPKVGEDSVAGRKSSETGAAGGTEDAGSALGGVQVDDGAEILIIENDSVEAKKIQTEIERINIATKTISFNDSINPHLTSGLKLVIIVLHEVDEQAYGIAIKLRAMKTIPIIAAGSAWTRSRVIKAVKYGVTDILLTPANADDIHEKINNNMVKMAA